MIRYPIPELQDHKNDSHCGQNIFKNLIFRYPFDHEGISVFRKLGIFFVATSCIMSVVSLVAALDSTILTFINYGASFFQLVSYKLLNLKNFKCDNQMNVEELNEEVKDILRCHNMAIR
jgi:hypothetical protein